jgi:GntR family transcriptional regulator
MAARSRERLNVERSVDVILLEPTTKDLESDRMPIETPQPEYRQVAGLLRAAIRDGEFPAGSQLPAEPELAARFGVTRPTVNRALAVLRAEGLIRPERGRGTTVNELPVIRRDTATRQRQDAREQDQSRGAFQAELQRLGLTARSDVTVEQVTAPSDVADLLGVDEGATVLLRQREMYANDFPVQMAASYFPLEIAEGTLTEVDTGPGGAYSRLAEAGYPVAEFTETMRVRPPGEDEARVLRMDADQRVYDITRTATTAEGRIVEVNKIVMPAHQWELSFTWPAE